MKYLFMPRVSWAALFAWFSILELVRLEGPPNHLMVGAVLAFLVLIVMDVSIRYYLIECQRQAEREEERRREFEAIAAEEDPGVLERLNSLQQALNQSERSCEELRLDLELARAEMEKAIEEREDIRRVLNFNRTALDSEKLACKALQEEAERLRKGGIL